MRKNTYNFYNVFATRKKNCKTKLKKLQEKNLRKPIRQKTRRQRL